MLATCNTPSLKAGPCENLTGAREEIAAPPRARGDLELIALKFGPSRLTADQATYDRVVADVQAIAAVSRNVASWTHFTPPGLFMNGKTLKSDVSR